VFRKYVSLSLAVFGLISDLPVISSTAFSVLFLKVSYSAASFRWIHDQHRAATF
jgi:hypothetical protein